MQLADPGPYLWNLGANILTKMYSQILSQMHPNDPIAEFIQIAANSLKPIKMANHTEKFELYQSPHHVRDVLSIKCGNTKCKRHYVYDTYGIYRENYHEFMDKSCCYMKVKKRKGIKGSKFEWKICKGCKSTYFCSRKCQKIAWIKFGHRQRCKKLQQIIVYFL